MDSKVIALECLIQAISMVQKAYPAASAPEQAKQSIKIAQDFVKFVDDHTKKADE